MDVVYVNVSVSVGVIFRVRVTSFFSEKISRNSRMGS